MNCSIFLENCFSAFLCMHRPIFKGTSVRGNELLSIIWSEMFCTLAVVPTQTTEDISLPGSLLA